MPYVIALEETDRRDSVNCKGKYEMNLRFHISRVGGLDFHQISGRKNDNKTAIVGK